MTTPAPRPCAVARGGAAERATWQLADDCLLLAGAAGTTALPLAEISAVAADDLTVTVTTPGEITTLSRLGADASFLAAELRTRWLPARAHALRLVGDGAPLQLVGAVAAPAGELFQRADLLLVGTNLVAAQHGHDVAPLFLALGDRLELDAAAQAVVAAAGARGRIGIGRLPGRTP